tara:strand:- start:170 stop:472 length:303 start_codon:yes stop_codon:yes gene_type:complete
LTGPHAYAFVRIQFVESLAEFDEVDQEGNDFWQKKVSPVHYSIENRVWWVNAEMTYNPEVRNKFNHRRKIYYNVKDEDWMTFGDTVIEQKRNGLKWAWTT